MHSPLLYRAAPEQFMPVDALSDLPMVTDMPMLSEGNRLENFDITDITKSMV